MNVLAELARSPHLQVVGWTVAHSVWQVAAAGAILWLVRRFARAGDARHRYLVAVAALLTMLAIPAATAWQARQLWAEHARCWARAGAAATAPLPAVCRAHGLSPALATEAHPSGPAALSPMESLSVRITGPLAMLGLAWSLAAAILLARGLIGWRRTRRLRERDVAPAPERQRAAVRRLAERLGVHRELDVLRSPHVDTPLVLGARRPAILLPPRALEALSDPEMETVLAHELAHVRRHDYAVNLAQTAADSLLFFHPAARWATRVVRTEREFCCDDLVAAHAPHGVKTYLRALLKLDAMRPVSAPRAALGVVDGALLPRARRLVEGDPAPCRRRRILAVLLLLAALATGCLLDVGHPAGASAWAVMTVDLEARRSPAPPTAIAAGASRPATPPLP